MMINRWWTVAVGATAAVLLVLLLLDAPADLLQGRTVVGCLTVVAFVAGWFLLRRRAITHVSAALALTAVLVLTAGVGTAVFPSFAIVQCFAYPALWITWHRTRDAILANVALTVAVGIGFLVSLGTTPPDIAQTLTTIIISLGFSLALGLWFTRVYDLVDERDRLIEELQKAQDQVAALSRDAGVLDERERLAREIHDTIAQDLTGLVLTAQRGRRELRRGNAPGAAEQLSILEDNARAALVETRGLVAAGAPVGVEGGLTTALNRLGERFERETGVTVTVRAPGTAELDRDSEVVLLRCAQEALANVRKHSEATAASVTVSTAHDSVVLRIADNGRGFDTTVESSGFGLNGMSDRLALAGGSLTVVSTPGQGTAVVASLPGLPGRPNRPDLPDLPALRTVKA